MSSNAYASAFSVFCVCCLIGFLVHTCSVSVRNKDDSEARVAVECINQGKHIQKNMFKGGYDCVSLPSLSK